LLGQQAHKAGTADISDIANIAIIADIAMDIADIADIVTDIAAIMDIITDIASIADIADWMLQILWRCIQSVMGVSCDIMHKWHPTTVQKLKRLIVEPGRFMIEKCLNGYQ